MTPATALAEPAPAPLPSAAATEADAASGAPMWITPPLAASPLRAAISALTRAPEEALLPALLDAARLPEAAAARARALALRIARAVRERARDTGRAGLVQGLLQEFALSSQEGVALMCLAEALLRIPDAATRDALIRDKVSHGNWQQHVGQSPSLFVNAAAWGLLLTGRLVATHHEAGLASALRRIVSRGGEPLVRKGVDLAMRMMGEQFVTGETIQQALANARVREAQGFRYSYDMLGEAALTAADAERYFAAYEHAIEAIGKASAGRGIHEGPGISIKLSALHPRYSRAQVGRVMAELYPKLVALAARARRHDIGLNIDAEESERLELSLDLLERLCHDPAMAGWNGVGFVIQGYQKRCPAVVDWIVDLARRTKRRLMVRLVKGAYWDSEIKRAQAEGQDGYPVYTRKAHTDVAYLACARKLLAAPDAVFPQFATHNAATLAAIHEMAGPVHDPLQYEFQCLHGMGEPLYEQVVGPEAEGRLGRACRVYAPVGSHDTLLAYLVRRLLENGANSSFVNRIADEAVPLESLVEDPVETVRRAAAAEGVAPGTPHPAIPLPAAIYGPARRNARGLDLASEAQLAAFAAALASSAGEALQAAPMLAPAMVGIAGARPSAPPAAGETRDQTPIVPIVSPADPADTVGHVIEADAAAAAAAVEAAAIAAPAWAAVPPAERAAVLERAADAIEARTEALCALLVREAGKTFANAVAEVREAVDFLRYDAAALRARPAGDPRRPLGAVVCISPWNFPLAIFTGQVAAALAEGNTVLAKPAEQTPLVAALAVAALHEAGVPRAALQFLPGRGETVGAALVAHPQVRGVLFTGSTEVARRLHTALAGRVGEDGQPVPLVAETGGQNAMLVDSSALAEQVVQDAVASAFDSAGQRCSALRLLVVQEDIAARVTEMLEGAMRELAVGDPRRLEHDVGPVIDAEAREAIERHVTAMRAQGRRVYRPHADSLAARPGCFVAPALIEIEDVAELEREVFGPVLHLLRCKRGAFDAVMARLAATGYGLTGGVHTRIDETVVQVVQSLRAGNLYVNRNVVGAVVGVQPFGGEGLSGTGPKAGGPLYALRLSRSLPEGALRHAVEGCGPVPAAPLRGFDVHPRDEMAAAALAALREWASAPGHAGFAAVGEAGARFAALAPSPAWRALPGPTGEANLYAVRGREAVLCLAGTEAERLAQLAAVLAVGGRAVWPGEARALLERLPGAVRECVALADDWRRAEVPLDAALLGADGARAPAPEAVAATATALAARAGAIVPLALTRALAGEVPLERLLVERSLSINTAAAGGNASLMTIG
jgi:RHH-type proline utilization regulon transcriptional repressor/proline dehydrogenase/delta 1-pyrroline-5-carboxylate dehydrogenase